MTTGLATETSSAAPYLLVIPAPAEKATYGVVSFFTMAYVALLPVQFAVSPTLRVAPADLFLILACAFAPSCFRYRKDVWSVWHLLLLLVFALASMVMAIRAGYLTSYALVNKDFGILVLFASYALVTSEVRSWSRMRRLLRVFVASVVVQNIIGIIAAVGALVWGIPSVFMMDSARLCGMLVDPNAYGGLLVCAFIICEAGSGSDKRAPLFKSWFLLVARITLGIGLGLTFSRSAWMAFGVAISGLLVTKFRRTLPALLMAMAGVAVVGFSFGNRFVPLFERLATRSDGGRWELIQTALVMFGKHPFLGGGITAFQMQEDTIVHVTAAWFLADFGLVGFAVFLGFIGWFIRKSFHAYQIAPPREKSIVLGLLLTNLAMLVLSFGIDAFYQRHWWLLFALIASSYSLSRHSRERRVLIRADQL